MANRIQVRRGTAAQWASANPVLAAGEPGVETDTGAVKVGDGASTWTALPSSKRLATDASVISRRPTGSGRVVFIGDSVTNGFNDQVTAKENAGRAFPTYAMLASQGRWLLLANKGVGGETSAQILARIQTDVVNLGADVAVIMAGMNDSGYGYTVAAYAANMTAMADLCEANQIRPVFCAVTASISGGTRQSYIARYNEWLRRFCGRRGYLFIDTFKITADTDGSLLPAYREDDVHPNRTGAQVIGEYVASKLASIFPADVQHLCVTTVGTDDLLAGTGLFLTATSGGVNNGVATGWTASSGINPGANSFSLIDVAGVVGKMQRIKATSMPSGAIGITRTAAAGTWTPGDRIAVSARVAADGAGEVRVQMLFTGAPTGQTSYYVFRSTNVVNLGHLYWEFTIPPGTTQVTVLAGTLIASLGGLDIGQFSVKNLTTSAALI